MAYFHLSWACAASPATVWDVVTDFAAYGKWMPLTRMRVDAGTPRPGWGFTGTSGIWRLGFSDPMLVTVWEPPHAERIGCFRVVKTGWLLGGWAEVRVGPDDAGARLSWQEEVEVRPLPFKRVLAPLLSRASGWAYGRAVDAMIAQASERER
jgi:hypothetical protein